MPDMNEITKFLQAAQSGNECAAEELLPLVYEELRKLAASKLAHEKPGQTLKATALVHEAYLRLLGDGNSEKWQGRGHFFAAAAEAMRRLLVEQARRKRARRHGGEFQRVSVDLENLADGSRDEDLLALDLAIERLEAIDDSKAKLVKLRYFAGLTNAQAADAMGIGVSTADRYWAFARAWLRSEINRLRNQ